MNLLTHRSSPFRRLSSMTALASVLLLLLSTSGPGPSASRLLVRAQEAAVADSPTGATADADDAASDDAGEAPGSDADDATPEPAATTEAEETGGSEPIDGNGETPAVEGAAPDGEATDEEAMGAEAAEDGAEDNWGEATADESAAGVTPDEVVAPSEADSAETVAIAPPAVIHQSGPFIDIFGDTLLSLEMVDESHAQIHQHPTNEALAGKKVVGLYFSADWCGPCRQFTPDLVSFYDRINSKKGAMGGVPRDDFEIVWISQCRTVEDFGQYFIQMKWLALPPQEAMGERGQFLAEKYKVKGIPHLVLIDEVGNLITTDARNKIPMDKTGVGFPWRDPVSALAQAILPKSLRLLIANQLKVLKAHLSGAKILKKVKAILATR